MTQQWSEGELGECNGFLNKLMEERVRCTDEWLVRSRRCWRSGSSESGRGGGQAEWSPWCLLRRWGQNYGKEILFSFLVTEEADRDAAELSNAIISETSYFLFFGGKIN